MRTPQNASNNRSIQWRLQLRLPVAPCFGGELTDTNSKPPSQNRKAITRLFSGANSCTLGIHLESVSLLVIASTFQCNIALSTIKVGHVTTHHRPVPTRRHDCVRIRWCHDTVIFVSYCSQADSNTSAIKRRFPRTERLFMKRGRQCELKADSVIESHQDAPATTGATGLDFRRADFEPEAQNAATDATMHCSRLVQSTSCTKTPCLCRSLTSTLYTFCHT